MLEVDAIHTFYGESHVLHGASLEVSRGEVVALLGRNGAGKTTLVRSIIGFERPRRGRIAWEGAAIEGQPPYAIARRGVGLVPQGRRLFAPLSVAENLVFGARPGPWTADRVYALFPRLRERAEQGAMTLSGGEQQMLAIGRALLTNPRLLLLDEPSEGLAPLIVRELGRVLAALKGEGLAMLVVEQNLPLALRVADRVYVLSRGRVVYHGSPGELAMDEDVKRRYLGIQ
jgi:branched-chain amino acid transport system ATP-binding protein